MKRHKERAEAVADAAHRTFIDSTTDTTDHLASQLNELATVVAALCDDLTPSEPTVLRRGCWLHDDDTGRWYLLVEQLDHSEQWWAVRFDRYGCASRIIHAADYQRVEAPDWWTA